MQKCIRHKATNLLLSVIFLAWGILPPGVEHAHAGGSDATHGHETHHEMVHHDSHERDFGDHHGGSEVLPRGTRLTDSVRHVHWQFFGLKFSMPAPEQPVNSGTEAYNFPPTVVRVVDEGELHMPAAPSFLRVLLCGICAPSIDAVWGMQPIPQSPNLVTTMPLCDSARLERSGVLLV